MRSSLEDLSPMSGAAPIPRWAWLTGLAAAAAIVAYYLIAFPIEYRHPIDFADVVRESANFFGVLAVAVWARRDVRIMNLGFVLLMTSLWMEVVDEFTAEPYWMGTVVPATIGVTGIVLVALGVREAGRRRSAEAARRARAEEDLRRSLSTLDAVVESTPDAIWVKGGDGRYLLANTAFAALVGRPEELIVGRVEAELFAGDPGERGRAAARALESGAPGRYEAAVPVEGDDARTFLVSRDAIRDREGKAVGTLGVARDISDRKAAEERLMEQAHHDALTGLANRSAFTDHLARALSRWKHQQDRRFAVLFLDIDRFKDVNDRYGHAVGDELLAQFARALSNWLRPEDFIARLGGDEFTILLHDGVSEEAAEQVAARILEGLRAPFQLSVGPVAITASVGVALSAPGTDTTDGVLRAADAAMYRAKESGRARHVLAEA